MVESSSGLKSQIIKQIADLGVNKGDVIFLTADLLRVGYYEKNPSTTYKLWIEILKEVVGVNGTLVIPAYTTFFFKYEVDSKCVFHVDSVTNSGSLSNAFSRYPGVKRSLHPTNSCFAIGPYSEYILNGHDELSSSYLPYQRVIELGGKQLFLGSIKDSKQSPMALHAVQEKLGLTRKVWQRGLFQTYYINNKGEKKIFTRPDFGGCTSFGFKLLGHHVISNSITFGVVGKSLSACIDCKKSFDIIMDLYKKKSILLKCDDANCADCHSNQILKRYIFLFTRLLKISFQYIRLFRFKG
jgi:aminoglycoside N3'-acetyltransferase